MPKLGGLRGNPQLYRGASFEDLKGDRLRALVFGGEPDGSKVIYDLVVRHDAAST